MEIKRDFRCPLEWDLKQRQWCLITGVRNTAPGHLSARDAQVRRAGAQGCTQPRFPGEQSPSAAGETILRYLLSQTSWLQIPTSHCFDRDVSTK